MKAPDYQKPDSPNDCSSQNNIDDAYMKNKIQNKSPCHNKNGKAAFCFNSCHAKVAGNIQNCGGNSGFHAVKDSGYQRAGGKGGIKQGDH